MFQLRDLAVLSKALGDGLLTADQFSEVLRELSIDPRASIESVLVSRIGLSQEKVSALIASTADQHGNASTEMFTVPGTPARAAEGGGQPSRGGDGVLAETYDSRPARSTPAMSADGISGATAEGTRREDQLDSQIRYQVKREVGRGGLGRVVLARDTYLGRDVAIKQLLDTSQASLERIERFFVEAQITGHLEHPGIVPVHALGANAEGQPFYSMKLIKGKTLADLIEEFHRLDLDDKSYITRYHDLARSLVDVCYAVAFAHDHGVIHRDIKPQNIMVGDFGETVLVDWGLAKAVRDGELRRRQQEAVDQISNSTMSWSSQIFAAGNLREETREGTVLGTVAYMSPEQARGAGESLDHRADIFSLGATLYAILTGRQPYSGRGAELLENVRMGQFVAPRELNPSTPAAVEAICLKAMAFSPDDRYPSALAFAEDLNRWIDGEPVSVYPEPWYDRTSRWLRRHRTFTVATAASIAVLLMALAGWRHVENQRVVAVESRSRTLLQQGLEALNNDDFQEAQKQLSGAKQLATGEATLTALSDEVDNWLNTTNKQLHVQEARADARRRLRNFRTLYDDAIYYGMLASGVDTQENVAKAKQSARAALALFDLTPTDGRVSQPETTFHTKTQFYTKAEIQQIVDDCRQLQWVYADAIAQPLPDSSDEDNRNAARMALQLIDNMPPQETTRKAYHLRRALYLQQAGDDAAANVAERQAENVEPRGAEDHFLLGEFHYRHENYPTAVEHFRRTLQLAPGDFWAQYFLGVCLARLQRWPEAIGALTASANRRSEMQAIYLLRGFAYGESGDLEAAETDFARAAEIDPNAYGLYLNRGVVRLRHGKLHQAIADFNTALTLNPHAEQAYIDLAEAYRVQQEYAQSLTVLGKVIETTDSPAAYRMRGLVHLEQRDDTAAAADFDAAISKAKPGSHLKDEVLAERGRIAHRQGKLPEALSFYERALRERPDLYDALRLRALVLLDLNREKEALEDLNRFLAESPLVATAYAVNDRMAPRLRSGVGLALLEKTRRRCGSTPIRAARWPWSFGTAGLRG